MQIGKDKALRLLIVDDSELQDVADTVYTSLADYDYFRSGTEYNAADCRSMSLVLGWLRANR